MFEPWRRFHLCRNRNHFNYPSFATPFGQQVPLGVCLQHPRRQLDTCILVSPTLPCFHWHVAQDVREGGEWPRLLWYAGGWCKDVLGPVHAKLQSWTPSGPAKRSFFGWIFRCFGWRTHWLGVLDPFQVWWEFPLEWVHAGLHGATGVPVEDLWGHGWSQACPLPVCRCAAGVGWVEDSFLSGFQGAESRLPPWQWRKQEPQLDWRCFPPFLTWCPSGWAASSTKALQHHGAQDICWARGGKAEAVHAFEAEPLHRGSDDVLCVELNLATALPVEHFVWPIVGDVLRYCHRAVLADTGGVFLLN